MLPPRGLQLALRGGADEPSLRLACYVALG